MTWDEVVKIGLELPGVEETTSYGTPSLKAFGKFMTRYRIEDDSVVLAGVSFDEREMLMEADPATFHTTAHYKDYPSVLARLGAIEADVLLGLFERRWRAVAPKRAVNAYDGRSGA